MKELLELKEWVTLGEAAKYLSGVFKSDVQESDLLQFAIDGHLRLSVHTVNPVYVRCGKIIPRSKARRVQGIPDANGASREVILAIEIGNDEVLDFDVAVLPLDGVADIPMFGGDRLDIEHRLQKLIGGPSVTSTNMDGTFLVEPNGDRWFQVQEHYEDNPYFDKKKLKKPHDHRDNFFPAGQFPEDASVVVRPESLFEFIDQMRTRDTARRAPARAASGDVDEDFFWLYQDWLLHDTWEPKDALQLLLGLEPRFSEFKDDDELLSRFPDTFAKAHFLNHTQLAQPDIRKAHEWTPQQVRDDDDLMALNVSWQKIRDVWDSGDHSKRAVPQYYVDWATTKGFRIPWLADARKRGFFKPKEESSGGTVRPLGSKERDNYLNIIGGLLELMLGKTPAGQRQSVFLDQAAIISALEANFPNVPGLKKRTLEGKFVEAKRTLRAR